jgi:hypothetical protein
MTVAPDAPPPATKSGACQPELLFGRDAVDSVAMANQPNAAYWRFFLERGADSVAPNLTAEPGILGYGSAFVPVTIDRDERDTSYPCSLYTQYVRYPLGEMRVLQSAFARQAARVGLWTLGTVLGCARVDRVVQWNSWLMSTNLLPSLSLKEIKNTTDLLSCRFPEHAILVKNIHDREDATLPHKFIEAGYHLIPSRKIYFFDGETAGFLSKRNVKQDLAALGKLKEYTPVEHQEFLPEDAPRILRLYEQLYLEKYSRLNPRYSLAFVENALKHRFLEFRGLRHTSGRVDAVFACFRREKVASTPFVGYDTSNRLGHDFYRLLVAMLLKRVAEEGTLLNYSSGAGDFKRRRGGEGCLEFNALYTGHLPFSRRLTFSLLGRCLSASVPQVLSSIAV